MLSSTKLPVEVCSDVPRMALPGPAAPQHHLEAGMSWQSPASSLDKVSLLGRAMALNSRDVNRSPPCQVAPVPGPCNMPVLPWLEFDISLACRGGH